MPGDGSCLFHSIAYGLGALGLQEDGHYVRRRIAAFMMERPDFEITGTPLRYWVDWDSRMTVASYTARLLQGSTWGGAIEMAACAQIYSVDVAVYEETYGGYSRISDFITDAAQPNGTLMVLYSGRSHYDALVPTEAFGAELQYSTQCARSHDSNTQQAYSQQQRSGARPCSATLTEGHGEAYGERRKTNAMVPRHQQEEEDESLCPFM